MSGRQMNKTNHVLQKIIKGPSIRNEPVQQHTKAAMLPQIQEELAVVLEQRDNAYSQLNAAKTQILQLKLLNSKLNEQQKKADQRIRMERRNKRMTQRKNNRFFLITTLLGLTTIIEAVIIFYMRFF